MEAIRIICELNNMPCIFNGNTFTTDVSEEQHIFDNLNDAEKAIEDVKKNEPNVYADFCVIIEFSEDEMEDQDY